MVDYYVNLNRYVCCNLTGRCILMLMCIFWMILSVLWMQMLDDICLISKSIITVTFVFLPFVSQ